MNDPIRNAAGERLHAHYTPGAQDSRELVLVAHGVTSHHERPWLTELCDALAEVGIASLRFSFAGNGESEGRYEEATITKEVEDLGSVLDACADRRVIYAGHSMGGAVGLLRAARDERLLGFVSLAGMVHVADFMQRVFGHLVPGRDVMLDKPQCPLSQGFLDDANAHGSLLEPAKDVRCPWLIVHGEEDELVPLRDSIDVVEAAGGHPELVRMPGVDHRFTDAIGTMCAAVVPWVQGVFERKAP